ncbi:MAG: CDP-diacylglycerol--serine O-phosphatidyltransferase [Deltaproteobacteria bacterium]|nr:MAG: CDP-diacylglycerol--serine O-phosphatidyltransferase [Deltaproteobacteria bacterium]
MAQRNSTRPRRHFSMLRGYQLADLITLANGAAGTASVFTTMSYLTMPEYWRIYLALSLLPLALILDIADGKVARRHRQQSPFGQELDSLADIVSFGVAPAAIAYGLGMRGAMDVIVLIYFVCCGVSRLARYNVTAGELADAAGKVKYFEGTPIPSSLILVAVLALCVFFDRTGDHLPLGAIELAGARWHPLSLLFFINGSTMISKTLRVPKV